MRKNNLSLVKLKPKFQRLRIQNKINRQKIASLSNVNVNNFDNENAYMKVLENNETT